MSITEYIDSPLGKIPIDWKVVELHSCSEFITKGATPTTYGFSWVNEGVVFLRSECVSERGLELGAAMYISDEADEVMKRSSLKENDILMTITGNVGRVCKVPNGFPKANINQHIARIRIKESLFEREFIFQYLSQDKISKEYLKITTGQAYPQISLVQVRNTQIAIPTLPEQKAIALILGLMDTSINNNNSLIAKKELQKKWLMQNLLTGKKRLNGFSNEWKEYHLGELFIERVETGFTQLPLLSVGQSGIYPQSESDKKDTSNEDKTKYKRICPDDIGYNTMRMWQGRSALSTLEGIVSPAYTIVTPRKNANPLFFSYLFKTPKVVNLFWRNSQGLVDDTLNCKFKDFAIVKIHLPELEEQKAIAKILQTTDKEILLLKAKTDKLKEQKKGLMQVLLTGKKRLLIKE